MIKALIIAPFIYAAYRIMNHYFDHKSEAYSAHNEETRDRENAFKSYLNRIEKLELD